MATHPHSHRSSQPADTTNHENADLLMQAAQGAGITDPRELSNFMGQMQVESQGFTRMHEKLGYSGDRLETILTDKKGNIRNGLTSEEVHAAAKGGEKTTAAALYGGKWGEGIGNRAGTDDSYAFRGAGFVHLTGRYNYEHTGKTLGLDLANKPELAAEPPNAARIAVQYWKENVVTRGLQHDVDGAARIINGGTNGLQERRDAAAHWSSELAHGYKPGQHTTPPAELQAAPAEPWKAAFESVSKRNPESTLDDVAKQVAVLTDPTNPGNALFRQAQAGMHAINAKYNVPNDQRSDNAAAVVAVAAQQAGMTRIDHMELGGPSGDKIIAAQGTLGTAQSKVIDVPTAQALNTPIEQSSQAFQAAQQQQAQQQQQPDLAQQQPGPAMSR